MRCEKVEDKVSKNTQRGEEMRQRGREGGREGGRTISNVHMREVGEEIVPHEHTNQNKVVDHSF